MGIEPFLVASSVTGVLAQRLIRLNCSDCTEEYQPAPLILDHFELGDEETKFYRGTGCDSCHGIGYRGRASIGELLMVGLEIAEAVLERPTTAQLQEVAVEEGMETLADDGLGKALKGITTLEELLRVLPVGQ